jgi:hypothetical protein
MQNSVCAARGSLAWHAAWEGLAHVIVQDGLGAGDDLAQHHEGEEWQYMGSQYIEIGMRHEFRHRYHPVTQQREYRDVLTDCLRVDSPKQNDD